MRRINQIILTVHEANQLATAANPHLHRLALILLDNLIEVQLRRKSETVFALDVTNWFPGVRKHNNKQRHRVSRYYAELLKLSVEQGWISGDEARILDFAHRLRNKTYHEGNSKDETEVTLGVTLLFRFIYAKFPEWRLPWLIQISPHDPVLIDEAANDTTGFAPIIMEPEPSIDELFSAYGSDDADTWCQRLGHCITYNHQMDIRPLFKRRIDNFLDKIKHSFDLITKYEDTDFNAVLAHRFTVLTPFFSRNQIDGKTMTDPVAALNIYIAILPHEEELLDICDGEERATRFQQIVNDHDYDPYLLQSLDLQPYYEAAEKVFSMSEADGITVFIKTENTLQTIATAADECAMDLDYYIQDMVDRYREISAGKPLYYILGQRSL